jgi:hypothetical protein
MTDAGTPVPNLSAGIDEFLTRLKTQRVARANVDQLLSGGGGGKFGSSGSDTDQIVKVTQVASNSQKWAIVKYVIIGVLIVAGLGTILYFVFNTGPGQNLKQQVQNNLPLGDKSKSKAVEPAAASRVSGPSGNAPLRASKMPQPPPPPPPIPSATINPYGGTQPYPPPHPHQNPTPQRPPAAYPQAPPPAAHPQTQAPTPAHPQTQAPTPAPQAQAPTPAPAPAPQPMMLVPIEHKAPVPAPKPNIGNVGGLPGPI